MHELSVRLFWQIPEDVKKTYPITCGCNGKEVFNPNFGYQPCALCDGYGRIFPKEPSIPHELEEAIKKTIEEFYDSHLRIPVK